MSVRLLLLFLVLLATSIIASLYVKEDYTQGQENTNVVVGCHDEPLKTLECKENYVLEKGTLQWGRWSNAVCTDVDTSKFKPITKSENKSKLYDIPKEFLGKQITNFVDPITNKPLTAMDIAKENPTAPTIKVRRGPPSLPIYNHYELKGVCKPISATISGCDNDKLQTLSCPDGFIIPGARMKYGRWDNNICLNDTISNLTPKQVAEFRIPDEYMGKQSIEWGDATLMSLTGNKDPAPGVYKHYEITAECKKPVVE
jgi:hypothetical protein